MGERLEKYDGSGESPDPDEHSEGWSPDELSPGSEKDDDDGDEPACSDDALDVMPVRGETTTGKGFDSFEGYICLN